ncbi:MAG: SAM-dependent methyltransferase [Bacteroidales bacterium]|nr:SAM-dependent methyltransferase [Bacteroidales bacterium]
MIDHGNDKKSAVQAKFDAQKIAFGPIMFQAAKALRDFGILSYLLKHRKGDSIENIAKELDVSVYGVKVLLEAGLSMELVFVDNSIYKVTKTGFFMASDELTRVNMNFTHDVNYLGFFDFHNSIKEGKPTGLKTFGNWDTVYEGLSQLPEDVQESWFDFDHFYSDTAFPEIMEIVFKKGGRKVLDVGGNTGKFSIKCAAYNDENQMTILDLPGQTAVADKNIKEAGFGNRINTHSINLLDATTPFPKGYNTIWMSQFLDCFSKEQILTLLQRSYDALDQDGSLFILETYWDRQKYEASTYSLHATSLYFTNIANGNSQMYHSSDLIKLIDQANMKIVNDYDNIGVSHTLFEVKKK